MQLKYNWCRTPAEVKVGKLFSTGEYKIWNKLIKINNLPPLF